MLPGKQALNGLIGKNMHLHGICVTICAAATWFTRDLVLTLEFETYMIESREAPEEDGPGYVQYITLSLVRQNKTFGNTFIFKMS